MMAKYRTIRFRILLLLVVFSISMFTLGVAGFWGMRSSFHAVKSINQERVQKLLQLLVITEELSGTMRSAILKMDEGELTGQEGIARMVRAKKDIKENWKLFLAGTTDPKEKQLSQKCDTLLQSAVEATQAIIEALEVMSNQSGGLLANQVGMLSSSLAPSIEPVLPKLDSLVTFQLKASQQIYLDSSSQYRVTMVLFIAILLIGFALSLTFGSLLYKQITVQLNLILPTLHAFSNGNLEVRIPNPSQDELGNIAMASNLMADSIQNMVTNIRQAVQSLASTSEELAVVSHQVNTDTSEASVQISESANSVVNVTNQIEQITDSTHNLSKVATELTGQTNEILKEIENVSGQCKKEESLTQKAFKRTDEILHQIETLEITAKDISSITLLIAKIASKTNLLALNATIEAANAGPAGSGFAVVANEVKDLARQTSKAAGVIQEHIERLNNRTSETVQFTRDIIEQIQAIHTSSAEISSSVHVILTTMQHSKELTASTNTATEDIVNAVEISHQTLEVISNHSSSSKTAMFRCNTGVGQITETAGQLAKLAADLTLLVKKFKGDMKSP